MWFIGMESWNPVNAPCSDGSACGSQLTAVNALSSLEYRAQQEKPGRRRSAACQCLHGVKPSAVQRTEICLTAAEEQRENMENSTMEILNIFLTSHFKNFTAGKN